MSKNAQARARSEPRTLSPYGYAFIGGCARGKSPRSGSAAARLDPRSTCQLQGRCGRRLSIVPGENLLVDLLGFGHRFHTEFTAQYLATLAILGEGGIGLAELDQILHQGAV